MRAMLLGVTTEGGTGGNARVRRIHGRWKNRNSTKVNPSGRGYLKGAYVSSFGGFIPANDPKFVIYIALDSPKKSYYGATVAAPLFHVWLLMRFVKKALLLCRWLRSPLKIQKTENSRRVQTCGENRS